MPSGDALWDSLISDLYLSAIDPAAAARLPNHLVSLTGGVVATCWLLRPDDGAMIGTPATNAPVEAEAAYRDHYYQLDPWLPAVRQSRFDSLVRGGDVIEAADLARSAYYNEFAAKHGMFHLIGAMTSIGRGETAMVGVISILRPRNGEDFDAPAAAVMNRLIPHLSGAFRLREHLAAAEGALRLDGLRAALDSLGVPAMVTDGHGAILQASASAMALHLVRESLAHRTNPHRVLQLPPGPARLRLPGLIAAAARGDAGGACRLPGLLLTVAPLPLALATLTGASTGRVLITFRPLDPPRTLPALAASAFGLTEAEAAVATALAAGDSPAEIAAARGVKITTVRTLLARAVDKTDSRNLRDLVRVLLALSA